MENLPDRIEEVPKGMNSKGFDVLCSFFQGQGTETQVTSHKKRPYINIKHYKNDIDIDIDIKLEEYIVHRQRNGT